MKKIEFLAASLPYGLKIHGPSKENVYDFIGFSTSALCRVSPIDKIYGFILTAHHVAPIIRHIDTLTQECVQADYNSGEPFIPIVELAKFENLLEPISIDTLEDFSRGVRGCCAKDRFNHQWLMYSYRSGFSIWHKPHGESEHRPTLLENQLQLFQQLLKWHYWPNKPEGEEVVYVTSEFNPYKKISMKTEFTK